MERNPFLSSVFDTEEKVTVFYMQSGEFFYRSADALALVEISKALGGKELRNRVDFYPVRTDPLQSSTILDLINWNKFGRRSSYKKLLSYLSDKYKIQSDKYNMKVYEENCEKLIEYLNIKKKDCDFKIKNILSFILYNGERYKRDFEDTYPPMPDSTVWIIIGRPQHYTMWQKNRWFRQLIINAGYPARYLIPPSVEDDTSTLDDFFLRRRLKTDASLSKMTDRKTGLSYQVKTESYRYRDDYGLAFSNIVMCNGIRRNVIVCSGLSSGGTYAATRFITDPTWYSQLVGIDQIKEEEGPIEVGLRVKCKKTTQESLYIGRKEIDFDQIEILNNDPIDYLGLTFWKSSNNRPYAYVIGEDPDDKSAKKRVVPHRESREFAKIQSIEKPIKALDTLLPDKNSDPKSKKESGIIKGDLFEVMKWCDFKSEGGKPTNEYGSNVTKYTKPVDKENEYIFTLGNSFIAYNYRNENGTYSDNKCDYYTCGERTKKNIESSIEKYLKDASPDKLPKPILILGASGTGKEKLYEVIRCKYAKSLKRNNVSLCVVNCAEYGKRLIGFLRRVLNDLHNCYNRVPTVLALDEFGDLDKTAQASLLRVLQDGTYGRQNCSSSQPTKNTRVLIVAGTSRPLEKMVEEGKMLPDLLSRFNIFRLTPLTERSEDAVFLMFYLLKKELTEDIEDQVSEFHVYIRPVALQIFLSYTFPRNTRDVASVVDRLLSMDLCKTNKENDGKIRFEFKIDEEDMKYVLGLVPQKTKINMDNPNLQGSGKEDTPKQDKCEEEAKPCQPYKSTEDNNNWIVYDLADLPISSAPKTHTSDYSCCSREDTNKA